MPSHFRKIPPHVRRKLARVDGDYVVAGCLAVVKSVDIMEGALSHLEVTIDESGLHYQQEVLPPGSQGKYSNRNTNGWVETRYDWPKENYTVSLEAPNWHGSGTHTVFQTRERLPKLHHAPTFSIIGIDCHDSSPRRDHYTLKCEVSDVLDRNAPDFEDRLLACLNLLQENVGVSDVAKPNAAFIDYARSLQIAWEVLPPGTREEAIQQIFGARVPTLEQRSKIEDRYEFLISFKPKTMIYGRSGFQRYFGAQLEDDIVLFENVEYGNAIYVMFEDWEKLSQKSRLELLSGRYGQGFERVVHAGNWKVRVLKIVQIHRRIGHV
jgi:hypothetical protein